MFDQAAAATPALMWRLDPVLARLTPGMVWEEEGRVVGNVTLLTTKIPARYLVANVAVHPDFRRRGIARLLMLAVEEDVRRRGGREILLQVERQNGAARGLYESLGYTTLGSITTWKLGDSRARDFARDEQTAVRELPDRLWREAYALDAAALNPDLQWPEPLATDAYRRSFWQKLAALGGGRRSETWATFDGAERLSGLAGIESEWGRAHQLRVRVHPLWQGRLERPLLGKLVRRVQMLPQRRVLLLHNADDETMNELAPAAHFRVQRTLTHMRHDLGG